MNINAKKIWYNNSKKIISSYAEKVNYYMKENKLLKTELEDAKTTLEINKEILYKNINLNIKWKNDKKIRRIKEKINLEKK